MDVFSALHFNLICAHLTLPLPSPQPEYCEKYAKPEDIGAAPEEKSSDEELSEDEYESLDDEMAGQADP